MSWSKKEQVAILKSLMFIVNADGKLDPNESRFIATWMAQLGLDGTDLQDAATMSQQEMTRIFRGFSQVEKVALQAFWIEAIKADGIVQDEEIRVFIQMAMDSGIDLNGKL